MADTFAKGVRDQLGAEAIRDLLKTGLQGFVQLITGQLGKKATERFAVDILGNDEADEQIYKAARILALEEGLMTGDDLAAHMKAICKWPRGRQNAYRRFVIQSWRKVLAESETTQKASSTDIAEELLKSTAKTIAWDAKLAKNSPELFKIDATFFDVDREPYDFESETERLSSEFRRNCEKHQTFNNTAKLVGKVLGIILLIVTLLGAIAALFV